MSMQRTETMNPNMTRTGSGNRHGIKIGDKTIDLSQFQRTFFCIGPICLRSGVGFGAGIGCGAGIGRGIPLFVLDTGSQSSTVGSNGGGGFSLPTGIMNQVPGGYQIMNLLKGILRRWPGSRAGAGCGIGVGYGVGIGLQYGSGGGGFGTGIAGAMGGMGGRLGGGMGMGMGMEGGSGGSGGMVGGAGGSGSGSSGGNVGSGGVGSGMSKETEERIKGLEKRVGELEDKLGMQLKMKELEERIGVMEKKKRR